jgi:hypothetical protein
MGWGSYNEDNWEAIRDALDPMPSHVPPPPRFRCPRCALAFETADALGEHITEHHLHRRPFLLLSGNEPPVQHNLRVAASESSVCTMFCNQVEVQLDGKLQRLASPQDLGPLLASERNARLLITLRNAAEPGVEPETSVYDITIRVPATSDLDRVEQAFTEALVTDGQPLSSSRVTAFLRACADAETARDYADALAAYVNGVLAKDQAPGTIIMLAWAEHEEKFKRALPVLAGIERPLARLVAGLIRFAMNDFPREPAPSGFTRLDMVVQRLAALAGRPWPPFRLNGSRRARRACPTDTGTDAVLATAAQLMELPRWGAPAAAMLNGQLVALDRFPLDRAKLVALGADAALRLGARKQAAALLRDLINDSIFGRWAEDSLNRLDSE